MDTAKLKEHGTLNLLTATIWGEAEGETIDGKLGVGFTIKHRSSDPRWPSIIEDVCLQAKQFSCWNEDSPRREGCIRALGVTASSRDMAWRECRCAACAILGNWIRDITQGANHYHRVGKVPYWARDQKPTAIIDHHLFYKL